MSQLLWLDPGTLQAERYYFLSWCPRFMWVTWILMEVFRRWQCAGSEKNGDAPKHASQRQGALKPSRKHRWMVDGRCPCGTGHLGWSLEAGRAPFHMDQVISRMRAVDLECRQGLDIVPGRLGPVRLLSRKVHPSLN